jgi:lipopolysaccharide export system protein LptA
MRGLRLLRYAIAVFVVAFAAIVVVSMRRGATRAAPTPEVKKLDPNAVLQTIGKGEYTSHKEGKVDYSITFGQQLTYGDGRNTFGKGVSVLLPDRDGRRVTIESREAEVTNPPGKAIGTAKFMHDVKLTTSDGIVVTSDSASYDDAAHLTTIPGALTFTKGRMTGTGVGATYDHEREVLWLLKDAKVDVAPDKDGTGAIHVTSQQAGMARREHYLKFTGGATLDGEGHVTTADDATAHLTEDDSTITGMELRGNSSIVTKPGGSGPEKMQARDIDITYGDDGRTLQSAHLVENAVVRLPAEAGRAGKQVAGKTIDVTLGPDGSTVTGLKASENVQVDLPAEGETPARRIRSAALVATGAPAAAGQPGGIRNATFGGGVEYRENRAAKGKTTAVQRTAKSDTLEIQTQPGFGDLERADFHDNVHFTDGPTTQADAPLAVYDIAHDQLNLSPGDGGKGKGPHVFDGRVSVDATRIQMGLSSQRMKADTAVRTVMVQQKDKKDGDVRMPSMLNQDQPVNVKSNRLDYNSGKSVAVYEGNARLWQDPDTEIRADTIVLEDKTGNLRATTNVLTQMTMQKSGSAKKPATAGQRSDPTITKADEMVYEDARHRAIYTGGVHMSGPDGEVTSDTLELYFAEQGGDLVRAEADGHVVSKQEQRRAFGRHLTYDAKADVYTMTGAPAMVYDDTPPNCKVTKAPTVSFRTDVSTGSASGNGVFGQKSEAVACGTGPDGSGS